MSNFHDFTQHLGFIMNELGFDSAQPSKLAATVEPGDVIVDNGVPLSVKRVWRNSGFVQIQLRTQTGVKNVLIANKTPVNVMDS